MVLKKIELSAFKYIPTGDVDYKAIQGSFDSLVDQLNKTIEELNIERGKTAYFERSVLIEGDAYVELLEANRYRDVKILSAFVMAADSLPMDQTIRIVDVNGKDLIQPKTIHGSEGVNSHAFRGDRSGKVLSFDPLLWLGMVSKFESATVVPTSRRKVVVTALFSEV